MPSLGTAWRNQGLRLGKARRALFPRLSDQREKAMTPQDDKRLAPEKPSAGELLPEVYTELRRLAAVLTARLSPGQTLQATALVHEAYLRLGTGPDSRWEDRRHFFRSAAQAMRHILIDQARRKEARRHGGGGQRVELDDGIAWVEPPSADVLILDEAIQKLQGRDPLLAEIVQLRYYTGLSVEETAEVIGVSVSTIKRDWRYARAWLASELSRSDSGALGGGDADRKSVV